MDKRQREIFGKAGGVALWLWGALTVLSVFAEAWVGNRALAVCYAGRWYFPVVQGQIAGREFGLGYDYETDYRELKNRLESNTARPFGETSHQNSPRPEGGGLVILPLIPYGPNENALSSHSPEKWAPTPPDLQHKNLLGTDPLGRDILCRLVYGYRNALIFSGMYLGGLMLIGTTLGMMFGYYGGAFDFWGQRIIEIWSNIPFIYVVMILSSIVEPGLMTLVGLSLLFGWTGVAGFVRSLVFRDKTREFVQAAKATGASDGRILFRHLLPQMGTMLLTFLPFQAVGAITTLTALDFLGFGLRPPEASWGELLRTGSAALQAPWIVLSVVGAMTLVLILLTVIGNALREAFDPKAILRYK